MSKLNLSDFYKINKVSEVTDLDKKTLTLLYEPFIGHVSLSLYLTLLELSPISKNKEHTLEFLVNQLDVTLQDLELAFYRLDATGLIRRYKEKINNKTIYTLNLYAPLEPSKFFNDYLFVTLLKKYVGEDQYNELVSLFMLDEENVDAEEVTMSFVDVYHPAINDEDYVAKMVNFSSGRKTSKLELNFDVNRFLEKLEKNYQINKDKLSDFELNKIERLAALYQISEDNMAKEVSHVFNTNNENGNNIDFDSLISNLQVYNLVGTLKRPKRKGTPKILKGTSNNVALINTMETTLPVEFLCNLLNVDELPKVNAVLINNLALKYNLTNGAINALIFWVIMNNNGNIINNYVESFATPLKANNLDTAVDVLDFLESNRDEINARKKNEKKMKHHDDKRTENAKKTPQNHDKLENNDDEDFDLEDLKRRLKGDTEDENE